MDIVVPPFLFLLKKLYYPWERMAYIISSLELIYKDLIILVWLPWDHMIRINYFIVLDYFQIIYIWDIPTIISLLNKLLPIQDQTCLQQFTDNFAEILYYILFFTDIFGDLAPFTNAPLKKLASGRLILFRSDLCTTSHPPKNSDYNQTKFGCSQ